MEYVVVTDSACDLPIEYVNRLNIDVLPIRVNIKGEDIPDDLGQTLSPTELYKLLRQGEMPSTSQINVYTYEECFRKHISDGKSIVYVGLSSSLSGSLNSAIMARETLLEEFPQASITLIDTKSASLGQGLLVAAVAERLEQGQSQEEVVKWAEEIKKQVNVWLIIDDLKHLKRGGRLSTTEATLGSLLSIKPILRINDEGKLVAKGKIKGRKKSIKHLAEITNERILEHEKSGAFEGKIMIAHGDCLEEAEELRELIKQHHADREFLIHPLGPTVGSHTGPGALVVIFLGLTSE